MSLDGCGILVTRPAAQADRLCQLIEQHGGRAIRFPTLEIGPPSDPEPARQALNRLADYQLAIFTSTNAVSGAEALAGLQSWPVTARLAAIGNATAAALAGYGLTVDLLPARSFTSEALLALPTLQQMTGQRVAIITGEGGRTVLADTLAERGAEVDVIAVYRRHCPVLDPAPLIADWQRGAVDAVIVTSGESLSNLYNLLGEPGRTLLITTPLIVISERTRQAALDAGHRASVLVAEPGDQTLIDCLLQWRRNAARIRP